MHRKIATLLRAMNPYIAALKTMSERLANTPNLRGYKLLHENPRHHDPRTYNRPTSDEVAVAWEGDPEDPLAMPVAKDVLIEAKSGERFSVPYWHPAYMPLRYPLIFPFGEPSWQGNIPNVGLRLGGSLFAQRHRPGATACTASGTISSGQRWLQTSDSEIILQVRYASSRSTVRC